MAVPFGDSTNSNSAPGCPTKRYICALALKKAYFNLLLKKKPKTVAFDAATRVFRYHYPKMSLTDAEHQTVEILKKL